MIKSIDADEAVRELHACLTAVNAAMQVLASMFPCATFLAGSVQGEPCNALAFATSVEVNHFTFEAMKNAQGLAKLIGSVPDDMLVGAFRDELAYVQERNRLLREMEQARAAALAAAAEEGQHQ